jgi:hypothetical protein
VSVSVLSVNGRATYPFPLSFRSVCFAVFIAESACERVGLTIRCSSLRCRSCRGGWSTRDSAAGGSSRVMPAIYANDVLYAGIVLYALVCVGHCVLGYYAVSKRIDKPTAPQSVFNVVIFFFSISTHAARCPLSSPRTVTGPLTCFAPALACACGVVSCRVVCVQCASSTSRRQIRV